MLLNFAADTAESQVLRQITGVFDGAAKSVFSFESILTLVVSMTIAIIAGRFIAYLLRGVVNRIGNYADRSQTLQNSNRLRRYETMIIISIALIRAALVFFALYYWWVAIHPNGQPTALIGASALFAILIGGAISPTLRDISSGSVMMAEQWYAVGDHVRIEPFADMQGVVERVTLRSTRIRGLNGEIVWINNQNIQAIRIIPKGIITMALEIFVNDPDRGAELVASVNRRLPIGELLVINPLQIMTTSKVGEQIWHITALAETAPGREWMIEKYAKDLMVEIDTERNLKLLSADPVARFADSEAEREFARAITNARKAPAVRRNLRKSQPRLTRAERASKSRARRPSKNSTDS